jgi:hypothetical protein
VVESSVKPFGRLDILVNAATSNLLMIWTQEMAWRANKKSLRNGNLFHCLDDAHSEHVFKEDFM